MTRNPAVTGYQPLGPQPPAPFGGTSAHRPTILTPQELTERLVALERRVRTLEQQSGGTEEAMR